MAMAAANMWASDTNLECRSIVGRRIDYERLEELDVEAPIACNSKYLWLYVDTFQ